MKWFKFPFENVSAIIEAAPDETAGRALKMIFRFLAGNEPEETDPFALAIFNTAKPFLVESMEAYQQAIENGKRGAARRWKHDQ